MTNKEIKTAPNETKNNGNTLNEDELKELNEIRNDINLVVSQLGEVEFMMDESRKQKEQLLLQTRELVAKRQAMVQKLSYKYGDSTINMATGEITPA